jgi:thiamine biosynthesis protein ThiS
VSKLGHLEQRATAGLLHIIAMRSDSQNVEVGHECRLNIPDQSRHFRWQARTAVLQKGKDFPREIIAEEKTLEQFSHLSAMTLTINGENREFSSITTLSDLVTHLGMKADRVAIELNRELIPRDRWGATQLSDGDKLEIVHFVGGGR